MTNQKTIVAIVAFAALMVGIPAMAQDAEASSSYVVNPSYEAIGFDQVIYFTYDIEDVSKTVSYAQGCYDRVYVTAGTYASSNQEFISWTLTENINYMCGITEYSGMTNFSLDSLDYTMSGPSGTVSGSSNSNQSAEIFGTAYGNSGTVHVTLTAHYLYTPLP